MAAGSSRHAGACGLEQGTLVSMGSAVGSIGAEARPVSDMMAADFQRGRQVDFV
jgi:hypothetical protein